MKKNTPKTPMGLRFALFAALVIIMLVLIHSYHYIVYHMTIFVTILFKNDTFE